VVWPAWATPRLLEVDSRALGKRLPTNPSDAALHRERWDGTLSDERPSGAAWPRCGRAALRPTRCPAPGRSPQATATRGAARDSAFEPAAVLKRAMRCPPAAIAFGHVERHGAERSSKLVREVPIVASDAGDDPDAESESNRESDADPEGRPRRGLRVRDPDRRDSTRPSESVFTVGPRNRSYESAFGIGLRPR
jgi:hypothetical protein